MINKAQNMIDLLRQRFHKLNDDQLEFLNLMEKSNIDFTSDINRKKAIRIMEHAYILRIKGLSPNKNVLDYFPNYFLNSISNVFPILEDKINRIFDVPKEEDFKNIVLKFIDIFKPNLQKDCPLDVGSISIVSNDSGNVNKKLVFDVFFDCQNKDKCINENRKQLCIRQQLCQNIIIPVMNQFDRCIKIEYPVLDKIINAFPNTCGIRIYFVRKIRNDEK